MSEAQAQGQAGPAEAQTHPEAQPEADKTFTQADLKKIAANEKREGRNSAVNEILERASEYGAESIDDVLAGYAEYSGIQEAVTTEADRANARTEKAEAKEKEWKDRYYAEKRGNAFREALRDSGINPERIKGAMRLADLDSLEVDKEGNVTGLEEVVEAVKEESPEWFGSTERPRINAPQTNAMGVASASPNGQTPEESWANHVLGLLDR